MMNFYHKFLELPESETAPDHYGLLGVPRFCDDAQRIHAAAVTQNTQLRAWQNSDYHREVNRLMGEVAVASIILEDPVKRAVYDAELRQRLGLPQPVAVAVPAKVVEVPPTTDPFDETDGLPVRRPKESATDRAQRGEAIRRTESDAPVTDFNRLFLKLGGVLITVTLLIAVPVVMWAGRKPPPVPTQTVAQPKVRTGDAELVNGSTVVESAPRKRDEADKLAFEQLQQRIDARQKLHDDERALGVAEQSAELVELRSQIATLKQTQALHADGAQRANGRGKQPTLAEPLVLAGSANLMPGAKARDRRVMRVRGFDVAFRWCPSGSFQMGSPANEAGRSREESQVSVTLTKGFWMLETEVTQELWTAFMELRSDWTVGNGPKYPAYNVSHDEAVEFCRKFNDEIQADAAGKGILVRLPTEAEWEYACRAGTKTAYSFGKDDGKLGHYAWHDGNSNNGAHPVGQKLPNDWGLCDMHGNLLEWCSDWLDSNRVGGPDPKGPLTGGLSRCYRGGGWGASDSGYFRSANRNGRSPSYRSDGLGFRIAAVPQ